jgi:hypothetical protein
VRDPLFGVKFAYLLGRVLQNFSGKQRAPPQGVLHKQKATNQEGQGSQRATRLIANTGEGLHRSRPNQKADKDQKNERLD